MEERKARIAITHGDFNGIGYEVILKAMEEPHLQSICTPILYGSMKIASYYKKLLEIEGVTFNLINNPAEALPRRLNIIDCVPEDLKVEFSKSTPEAGKAAFKALERVMEDIRNRQIDALVTAPINKNNIQSKDFDFPGHTEYLQQSAAAKGQKALMILCSEGLRVALVTGHVPVSQISSSLTVEKILEKIQLFNQSLRYDYAIIRPRIAVLALNPHASDGGLIGDEERLMIIPALQAAKEKGLLVFGPYPADGFFGSGNYKKFDGVLAMYHDQGLAPFKALSMESGVNFTAGLPFVRTSPAHGTAYDIAGQGIASEDSFRQALYMAVDVVANREQYYQNHKNPLRKQYYDRGGGSDDLNLTGEDDRDRI
ncbi:MAG: 4-hydroxythreonine-4-phosphate dehydrogenase PdxA [Bacteroidales bacterium]|nr:4-hydroxythreonine-4-phosphate dehydrogenase PdxA [Bacteroidales bacterium]